MSLAKRMPNKMRSLQSRSFYKQFEAQSLHRHDGNLRLSNFNQFKYCAPALAVPLMRQ